ncbi:endonuclease dU [Methanohalophilus portucalensis]|uniref:endonuclease dU n=1 Tax=Methanohalophilus portucalensis TaxID=39664 RepID=UPI000A773CA5
MFKGGIPFSLFHIKPEIRILGIDDSALVSDRILVVGTFFRGGMWLDGVLSTYITRDGMDATDSLIRMISASKHRNQARVIMLDGVTYGGFNPIDIVRLNESTGMGVIVLMRSLPNFENIKNALYHLECPDERFAIIKKAGSISRVVTSHSPTPVYIQCAGIDEISATRIVQLSATHSNIPEPLRVAHLIATGIICGESCGKP